MRRYAPAIMLALVSPFMAEILFGATPLSRLESLPPLVLLYGGGAVLIREIARRINPGWDRVAWLGAAYALVEEGLVMQTFFSPDLFDAANCGGRALGVNWVWAEALIGYHIVWSIVIPIALVEICFPKRRTEPWLGRAGVSVALACYTLGALGIGITFRRFVSPHFRASVPHVVATGIAAAAIVAWRGERPQKGSRNRHREHRHARSRPLSPGSQHSSWRAYGFSYLDCPNRFEEASVCSRLSFLRFAWSGHSLPWCGPGRRRAEAGQIFIAWRLLQARWQQPWSTELPR